MEGPDVHDKIVTGFTITDPSPGSATHSLNDLSRGSTAPRDCEHTGPRQDYLDLVRKHDSLSQLSECDRDAEKNAPERMRGSLGSGSPLIDGGSSSGTSGHDKVEHDLAWR